MQHFFIFFLSPCGTAEAEQAVMVQSCSCCPFISWQCDLGQRQHTLGAVDHSRDDPLRSTFDQMTLIDWQVVRAAARCSSFCTRRTIEKHFVAWKRLGNDESFSKVWQTIKHTTVSQTLYNSGMGCHKSVWCSCVKTPPNWV